MSSNECNTEPEFKVGDTATWIHGAYRIGSSEPQQVTIIQGPFEPIDCHGGGGWECHVYLCRTEEGQLLLPETALINPRHKCSCGDEHERKS